MAQYDPKVILEFAERLYKKADSIITTYSLIGALLGGGAGYFIPIIGEETISAICGLVILAFIGLLIGTEKAFSLKLKAQVALCQVKIEENTRR